MFFVLSSNCAKRKTMTIDIIGDIDDFALPRLEANLAQYNGEDKELTIKIDSWGGYVDVAQSMCEKIVAFAEANDIVINTENIGDVMSAATLFFLLGNKRTFDPSKGDFLIHNPWCFNVGDAQSMYECGDSLSSLEDYFADYYAMTTGSDKEQIKEIMSKNDVMPTEQLTAMNFCTELIKSE